MEYQDKKPRRKREDRQEIGEQLLVGSIIGEIDRLEAIGKQAGRTAGNIPADFQRPQRVQVAGRYRCARHQRKRVCGRI